MWILDVVRLRSFEPDWSVLQSGAISALTTDFDILMKYRY
jgi:hypothetical protein